MKGMRKERRRRVWGEMSRSELARVLRDEMHRIGEKEAPGVDDLERMQPSANPMLNWICHPLGCPKGVLGFFLIWGFL